MPEPLTAAPASPETRAASGCPVAAGAPAGPDGQDSAARFRTVQDRAECSFARHSRLTGMRAHHGPDAHAAGRAAAPALRAFTACAEADRLDGFVIELTAPAHGATLAAVAATTRAVLAGILAADGDEDLRGLEGAADEHWWLRACGTRWFALVFAPAYRADSPRHTYGSTSTFVLLQPVEAFDRRSSPRGTAIAQAVREDIRARYAAGGRPYDAELAAQDVEALKVVWPHRPGDTPVRWWEGARPASPSPAAAAPAALAGTAAAAALEHAASPPAVWDAVGALLRAAAALGTAEPAVDRETLRSLLAGLAALGLAGPHRRVRLHSARPETALPDGLRPAHREGAPEEDVFRLALAAACPGDPWPAGPVDNAVLADAVRRLGGRLGARVPALAAVAALHLLEHFAGQGPAERRWTLRRLTWLTDPRAADAPELMRLLTGPEDLLVRLPATSGAPSGTDDDEEPLPLADWHRPPGNPGEERRLGGRVQAVRRHREWTFADLSWADRTVQLAFDAGHPLRPRPGDLLAVRGHAGHSRTGAPVLFVDEVLRHRPTRSVGAARRTRPLTDTGGGAAVADALRPELGALGFAEMASPVLTAAFYGGASRPFTTRHASRNRPLYLRVTTELDLLRRLAEGRTRVYEIGASFRNEPLRGDAVKEFTMLEAYAADLRLEEMTVLVAGLVARVLGDDRPPRWTTFDEAFTETSGVHPDDEAAVRRLAAGQGTPDPAGAIDPQVLVRRLWRSTFRHRLPGVALVHRIPGPASPFIAGDGRDARRVWLSVDGVELAETSANERDPDRLARRLARQFRDDPHPVHRDYRDVLETFADGVPPCVGVGLGLTRLAGLHATRRRPDTTEEHRQR